jgi:glycyl-tRNA synthetase beta chain
MSKPSQTSATAPLVIELLTEELPPKALRRLGDAFSSVLSERLFQLQVCDADAVVTAYAAPRRLAIHISAARAQAPNASRREKLLPVAIALDAAGQPTAPLVKKLASLGAVLGESVQISDLERVSDGKQEVFYFQFTAPGLTLIEAAQIALDEALAKLPIPKVMVYQRDDGTTVKFVRPAHQLLALHGDQVLPLTALGLTADRFTAGHRFHAPGPLAIDHADHYADTLAAAGKVVAHFEQRRKMISDALIAQAAPNVAIMPDALLDEVTGLVEWPVVLGGVFAAEFLSVPQECLILTMQQNQKYFALTGSDAKLVNRFLLVSNITSKDPQVIISGNERVLRARLSDAKFFFDQDRKKTLASRTDQLAAVTYHNKIGNQRQRIERLAQLARQWAPAVGALPAHAERAALLAKADLLTDMVGEFPELQGVIGTYYARHDQEPEEVALAISAHYQPRFSGDELPGNPAGLALALADKMETLVGIWGIGLAPTGDKDPYALRRHALGVIRILVEKSLPLSLTELIAQTAATFSGLDNVKPDLAAIHQFACDRLRAWLREKDYTVEEIEAVLAQSPDQLHQVIARLDAVRAFMMRPEALSLCAANKRIGNLLKKSESTQTHIHAAHLVEAAEQALAKALDTIGPESEQRVAASDYAGALAILAQLKSPVDAFFESVMVNADDPALKANRLALISQLYRAMNQVADLSKLAI